MPGADHICDGCAFISDHVDAASTTRIFDLGAIWRRLTSTEARALEGGRIGKAHHA